VDRRVDDILPPFENEEAAMADTCHMCDDTSQDDCAVCHQPTCKRHGRYVGDRFVCRDCVNKAEDR
jgi:hypothetical protein